MGPEEAEEAEEAEGTEDIFDAAGTITGTAAAFVAASGAVFGNATVDSV